MLLAYRLAGLSGLKAHYAGIHALVQSPPPDRPRRPDALAAQGHVRDPLPSA
jgi:hypothetical protein